jgi:hypothetical protein
VVFAPITVGITASIVVLFAAVLGNTLLRRLTASARPRHRVRNNEYLNFALSLFVTDTLLQRMYNSVARSLAKGKRDVNSRKDAKIAKDFLKKL